MRSERWWFSNAGLEGQHDFETTVFVCSYSDPGGNRSCNASWCFRIQVPGGNPIVAEEMITHQMKGEKSVYNGSVHSGSGSHEGSPKSLSPKTLSPKPSGGTASNSQLTLAARLTLQHLSSPSSSLGLGITRDKLTGSASASEAAFPLPRTMSGGSGSAESGGFPPPPLRATHSSTIAGTPSVTEPSAHSLPPARARSTASPSRYLEPAHPRYAGYPGASEVGESGPPWHVPDPYTMQPPVVPHVHPMHHSVSASAARDWQRSAGNQSAPRVPTSYFATDGWTRTRDDMEIYAPRPHSMRGPHGYLPPDGHLRWHHSHEGALLPELPFNVHGSQPYYQDVHAVYQHGDAHLQYEQAHVHVPYEHASAHYEPACLGNPTPSAPVWRGEHTPEIAPRSSTNKPPRRAKTFTSARRQSEEIAVQAPVTGGARYRSVSFSDHGPEGTDPRTASGSLEAYSPQGEAGSRRGGPSSRSASPAVGPERRKR